VSITNSLYIGISGLLAHGDAIGIVGDNIANTSTVGFKRSRASFSDLLGGEVGAQRLGGGVRLGAPQTMWDQGTIAQTGNGMDVAINGGGMFVVKGSHAGRDNQFYTRDGRFQLDNKGFVVDSRGLKLQGYPIDPLGNVARTVGDLPLGARQSAPVPTTNAKMSLNLDSDATVKAAFDPANPVTTSNYATSATMYDSLGKGHRVEVYFRAQGNGGWEWHAMADGGELTGGTPGQLTEIGTGTMNFNSDGKLQSQTITPTSVNFVGATPNQPITFNFGDDIASGGTGLAGTTQFSASESAVTAVEVDGHGFGNLTDLSISSDGTITGVFDNGDRINLAKVALADFVNLERLERAGDGLVMETAASGTALIDNPQTGARGMLVSGALEQSNVDLSTELVTLIAYQRAFQANSKTVTTADEMMAEVANLKR
jgi:flagellar hook protein FlgE